MKVVLQRVLEASVKVEGKIVGEIDRGLLIFLGVGPEDDEKCIDWLINKISKLRVFEDDAGKLNDSLLDVKGELLIISQFTLYGDCKKGLRPSFSKAANPSMANNLYEKFIEKAKSLNIKVETGIFGADMKVSLINDGPITLILDTKD